MGEGERLVFVFHYEVGVVVGVPLWMMCVEHCLLQLSTLQLKEAFFQPRGKSSTSSDPAPSRAPTRPRPPTPPTHQLLPAPLPPGPGPSASCGPDRAGSEVDTLAPVLRRDLFFSWTGACWYWRGGAEGWRGSFISFSFGGKGMGGLVPRERRK